MLSGYNSHPNVKHCSQLLVKYEKYSHEKYSDYRGHNTFVFLFIKYYLLHLLKQINLIFHKMQPKSSIGQYCMKNKVIL